MKLHDGDIFCHGYLRYTSDAYCVAIGQRTLREALSWPSCLLRCAGGVPCNEAVYLGSPSNSCLDCRSSVVRCLILEWLMVEGREKISESSQIHYNDRDAPKSNEDINGQRSEDSAAFLTQQLSVSLLEPVSGLSEVGWQK